MLIRLCLAVLSLLVWSTVHAGEVPAKDRTVVLITVDGFPGWIWKDPTLSMPTVRKLAAEGTVCTAMKVSNPSVTWPNHTTLVTGVNCAKHGVLFNGVLTRHGPGKPNSFEPWRDKNEMIRVPTVYDAAFKAGLTTAHVDWIPTQNAGTFNWEFKEKTDASDPLPKEMIEAGLITKEEMNAFNKANIVFRDELWTRGGEYLIGKHRVNFLLFHLLATDSANHKYGPGTLASMTAYSHADSCIRRLIDRLNATRPGQYTVLIATDHGFKTAKRIIRMDALLRREGLLKRAGPTITHCDVVAKTSGGSSMLYITDPAKKAELTPKLKELCRTIEGVAGVYDPTEYSALGLPQPTVNEQMGDLFLAAKSGYAFKDSLAEGDVVVDVTSDPSLYPGHHGYLNDDPQLDGTFIAFGYGIKAGHKLESMRNLDVAPTLARLMNIELPNVEGKVLEEILTLPAK